MSHRLSRRQEEALGLLIAYRRVHGHSPTRRELGLAMRPRVSPGVVGATLATLEAHGYVTRVPGAPRSVVPLRHPDGRAIEQATDEHPVTTSRAAHVRLAIRLLRRAIDELESSLGA